MVNDLLRKLLSYLSAIYLGLIGFTFTIFQQKFLLISSIVWSMALQSLHSLSLSPISRFGLSHREYDGAQDGIGMFTRFSNMAQSLQPSERQDSLRIINDSIKALDDFGENENFEKFFQIICELGADEVWQVRGSLLEKFPTLFSECRKSSNLNPFVDRYLTPCLTGQLSAVETVRKAALDVIGILLEQRLFSEESLKHLLVPTLFLTLEVTLEIDDNVRSFSPIYAEEIPLETCTVICRVISMQCIEDRDWLFQNFIPKFSTFLRKHSTTFQLRKAAIQIFGSLAGLFGEGFAETFLVPHLVSLSYDDTWGVRKAVCEVFVDVATYTNAKVRREILAPIYLRLLNDKIRWVSSMAGQELGRFISTFADYQFSGLTVQEGKVVDQPLVDIEKKEDEKKYASLPPGCYLPDHDLNNSSIYHQESCDDSRLLVFEKLNNRHSKFAQSVAALGRCSSSDNLSKVGLDFDGAPTNYDDDDDEFENTDPFNCTMDEAFDLEQSEPMSCESNPVLIQASSSPDQLSYWRQTIQLSESDLVRFGILLPFGSSPKSNIVTFQFNNSHESPEKLTFTKEIQKQHDLSASKKSLDALQDEAKSFETFENVSSKEPEVVDMDIGEESTTDVGMMENPMDEGPDDTVETIDLFNVSNDSVRTSDLFDQNASYNEDTALMDVNDSLDSTLQEINASTSSASTFTEMEATTSALGDRQFDSSYFVNVSINTTADLFGNGESCAKNLLSTTNDEGSSEAQLKEFVPLELVQWFVKEVDEDSDSDYNKHRARAFPAVALTLGKRYWQILRQTYLNLVNNSELTVRSLLAASLHDLAAIVGPEIALADLVPVFNKFREDEEEVRQNLLQNLFEFFERVPDAGRIELLHDLPHMLRIDNSINWRFRRDFAIECGKLCSLYSLDEVNRGLSGIALTLCSDRIDEVRDVAAKLTAQILGMMVREELVDPSKKLSDTKYTQAFVEDIVKGYAHSRVAKRRITFTSICKYLLLNAYITKEQCCLLLLEPLLALSSDKVVNVRFALSQVLLIAGSFAGTTVFLRVKNALQKLSQDVDGEVSRSARRIMEGFEDEYLIEMGKPFDVTERKFHLLEKEEEYFLELADHLENLRRETQSLDSSKTESIA